MTDAATVADLLDRAAIADTLYRYGSTIDVKDYDGLRAIFTDRAVVRYSDAEPLVGADAVVAFVRTRGADVLAAQHHLTVYHVDLTGDSATALTYVTSHQILNGRPGEASKMVARHHDRLVRRDGRWLISEKHLEVVWREVCRAQ